MLKSFCLPHFYLFHLIYSTKASSFWRKGTFSFDFSFISHQVVGSSNRALPNPMKQGPVGELKDTPNRMSPKLGDSLVSVTPRDGNDTSMWTSQNSSPNISMDVASTPLSHRQPQGQRQQYYQQYRPQAPPDPHPTSVLKSFEVEIIFNSHNFLLWYVDLHWVLFHVVHSLCI